MWEINLNVFVRREHLHRISDIEVARLVYFY